MAVKVKLEKDGFKKDAYVGFSWTTLFLGIWVPSFRLDLKGFLVFLGIKIFQVVIPVFLIINSIRGGDILTNIIFYVIYLVFTYIINFLLAIFYNKIYTRAMLLDGWGPMENDDYSLAILDAYNYIEYEIDEEDKEKIQKLIADGKAVKDKEDAEKTHIDSEIERIQNEFQSLFQKYQVQPTPDQPQN